MLQLDPSLWDNKFEVEFLQVESWCEFSLVYLNDMFMLCFAWWPSELRAHYSSRSGYAKITFLKVSFSDFDS